MTAYEKIETLCNGTISLNRSDALGTITLRINDCTVSIYEADYFCDDLAHDLAKIMYMNHDHPAWDDMLEQVKFYDEEKLLSKARKYVWYYKYDTGPTHDVFSYIGTSTKKANDLLAFIRQSRISINAEYVTSDITFEELYEVTEALRRMENFVLYYCLNYGWKPVNGLFEG